MSPSKEGAARIKSQLSVLARSEISNPPAHGARLVSIALVPLCSGCDPSPLPALSPSPSSPKCFADGRTRFALQVSLILNNAELFEEWKHDIRTMAGRIIDMRKELHRLLTEDFKTPGNWDHIMNQIGMFRYVVWLILVAVSNSVLGSDVDDVPADIRYGMSDGSARCGEVVDLSVEECQPQLDEGGCVWWPAGGLFPDGPPRSSRGG